MDPDTQKKLIGAIVAAALAFAVYYGLISQQAANNIQTETNKTLGTAPATQQQPGQQPAPQQPAPAPQQQTPQPPQPAPQPPATQAPAPQAPAPNGTPPQAPAPPPKP